MKRKLLVLTIFQAFFLLAYAQKESKNEFRKRLGLKAGLNLMQTGNLSQINAKNQAGFMIGGYFSPSSKTVGYRTEIIFSRQGYDYRNNTQTGNVKLDYLIMPQLMTINITRFFQLQAGGQIALLLNAGVDSSASPSSSPSLESATEYYKKLIYGFAGGLEIRPFAGLIAGGRYNLFLNMLNENQNRPPYIPASKEDLKNGLIQLYVGYQF